MDVKALGLIRTVNAGVDLDTVGDTEKQMTLSGQREQLIAQAAAPYQEVVRVGRSYKVGTTAAIAGVIAIPSTSALLQLYNNESDGGLSYIIDWIAASGVAKTAAAGQQQMLVCIGQAREAIPTDAALPIISMNGAVGSIKTKAKTVLNGTTLPAGTGVVANWIPWGPSVGNPGAGATPGNGLWVPVEGRIIIPPGRFFAIHVLSDVVGSTFQGFIGWHEKQLALG